MFKLRQFSYKYPLTPISIEKFLTISLSNKLIVVYVIFFFDIHDFEITSILINTKLNKC